MKIGKKLNVYNDLDEIDKKLTINESNSYTFSPHYQDVISDKIWDPLATYYILYGRNHK